jgi:hypothetical protein
MGAHDFMDGAYGLTPEGAYTDLVNASLYESGHNPYNGTISTTDHFIMIPKKKGESDDDWFQRVIEDERIQKWEACACRVDDEVPEENGKKYYIFAGWAAC